MVAATRKMSSQPLGAYLGKLHGAHVNVFYEW